MNAETYIELKKSDVRQYLEYIWGTVKEEQVLTQCREQYKHFHGGAKLPELIQGTETRYLGKYPQFFIVDAKVVKVIDASCTANARKMIEESYPDKPYKEVSPDVKKHQMMCKKIGYCMPLV